MQIEPVRRTVTVFREKRVLSLSLVQRGVIEPLLEVLVVIALVNAVRGGSSAP